MSHTVIEGFALSRQQARGWRLQQPSPALYAQTVVAIAGELDAAYKAAGRFQDIFGRDHFFVELHDHGIDDQASTVGPLLNIAHRLGAPLLATTDSHYTDKHDADAHDALLCVQTGALKSDANRFKFDGEEFYIKSAVEMRALFAALGN